MHGSVRPHCFSDSVDDIGVASVAAEFAVRSRIAACDRSAGQNGLLTSGAAALGQPAFASSIIATPDVIFPDVQNPHWKPLCSTNACRPLMVVIRSPSCITARVTHGPTVKWWLHDAFWPRPGRCTDRHDNPHCDAGDEWRSQQSSRSAGT